MKKINIQLSVEELQTLIMLTDNQLFRIKFIDPKLPGHTHNAEDLSRAQAVVGILKDVFKTAKGHPHQSETSPGNGISKPK